MRTYHLGGIRVEIVEGDIALSGNLTPEALQDARQATNNMLDALADRIRPLQREYLLHQQIKEAIQEKMERVG